MQRGEFEVRGRVRGEWKEWEVEVEEAKRRWRGERKEERNGRALGYLRTS